MMVVAVGISSDEVRSLAGDSLVRAMRRPGLQSCLVVSGDPVLRNRLEAVSELSGWTACSAPDTSAELQEVVDDDFQLVVVDVARPLGDRVNDSLEVAEEFAARPGTLLVVCGSEDNIDEELWARQLGAWVYLPGITTGDALVALFSDACHTTVRRGVEQLV